MAACLVASVVMLLSRPSFAERVVLVRIPKSDLVLRDAFNRMQAELNLQLFEVALRDACITEPCPTVSEIAQAEGAVAAIQLQRLGAIVSAQLCVLDRITGEPDLRELTSESSQDTATVIAIRAVDLLRERLREPLPKRLPNTTAEPAPKPPPVTVKAPVPLPPVQVRPIPRNALRFGVLGMATASHISPAFGGEITFERLVKSRVWLGLDITQTAFGAAWRTASGTATIRQTTVAGRASYTWFELDPFESALVLGVGLHYLRASSTVRAPLEGQSDSATAWLGSLGAPLLLRVSPHVAVEVEPSVTAMTPKPTIAIASQQMPYWWLQFRALIGVRVSF